MIKLDPIIAVRNVQSGTKWYQDLFGFKKLKEHELQKYQSFNS